VRAGFRICRALTKARLWQRACGKYGSPESVLFADRSDFIRIGGKKKMPDGCYLSLAGWAENTSGGAH